jgi:hypothetical protein
MGFAVLTQKAVMAGSFAGLTARATQAFCLSPYTGTVFPLPSFTGWIWSGPVDRLSSEILEEAVNIAWSYLYQTGELGDDAAGYLSNTIEKMIRQGQRNRMFLANKALTKYRTFRQSNKVIQFR